MMLQMAGFPSFLRLDIVYVHHIFYIHPSFSGHIGWLHILAMVNTEQWTWEGRYLFKILISIPLDKYPKVRLLDGMVVPALIFWGTTTLISTIAVPIYIPTNSVQGFTFLHILPILLMFLFFKNSYPHRCEMISHCGFDLPFPDDYWHRVPFHIPVFHLYVFFGEMSIQILCPFVNWVICFVLFLCSWVVWILYIFWMLAPYRIYGLHIFSPIT